jgi:hypothetical protein
MAAWAMWKAPSRSAASSKARWAAVHSFAGRPRRRHRPPAGLVELDRGVGEAMVGLAAIPAARVPGRGKSIDKATYGSVSKSTNELSVGDHADDDSDRDTKGRPRRHLRAPIRRRRTNGTPLGTPLCARHRAGGVASRSVPSRRRSENTIWLPPATGLESRRRPRHSRFGTGPMP